MARLMLGHLTLSILFTTKMAVIIEGIGVLRMVLRYSTVCWRESI